MTVAELLLWGFAATLLLTVIMAASRPLGLTRMDLPFLVGAIFTGSRNKAPVIGFAIHLFMGWVNALVYAVTFHLAGIFTWWFGLALGFVHGVFVLSVGLQLLGAVHPRMAQPYQGPTPTRQLQPPGFFALNYGRGTPLVTMLAHMAYGLVLGLFLH
ncbi:hypothetical protein HRG84_14865 [Flavisolibacter sp. BT320]|nr:hypothetical protein [Flavisolibacter longurius]